jgi:hypothetical protein
MSSFCEAELRFLLLFLEKEEYIPRRVLSGASPRPRGSASRKVWVALLSAKQNYAFCFFFWKKKNILLVGFFLGPAPDPMVPLRGRFGLHYFLRSRTNAFCFFFWKKKNSAGQKGFFCGSWG